MNFAHRCLCKSNRWRHRVATHIFPWTLDGVDLGSSVLEIGPGPGVTTDLLRGRVTRLTCVEIDRKLAEALAQRTAGSNVHVICEDATAMSLAATSFDGAVSFMMLHHVPSKVLQDRLLREVARVLRPGAVFAGVDSVYSTPLRLLHLFDTMVLVDPYGFPDRLTAAGFTDVCVEVDQHAFRFFARRG
jgi:SAM-dependent methyltransferase